MQICDLCRTLSRMPYPSNVRCYSTAAEVNAALGEYVASAAASAVAARGRFVVATSGGSLPKSLGDALQLAVDAGKDLHTDKWHIFYVDERVVPLDHADSNHAATAGALYGRVRRREEEGEGGRRRRE